MMSGACAERVRSVCGARAQCVYETRRRRLFGAARCGAATT
jgi:hypothetical protein